MSGQSSGRQPADPLIRQLRELVREMPDLAGTAEIYEAVLPLLRDADLHVAPVPMDADRVRAMLAAGEPLLPAADLEIDAGDLRALMVRLAAALEGTTQGAGARGIGRALASGALDCSALMARAAAGSREAGEATAPSAGVDIRLLDTLTEYALRPALWAWRAGLAPLLQGIAWDRGFCPVCGSPPLLAELQGAALEKHLRCGRCGADWRFPRIGCPSCGNGDQRTLRFLYEEGLHDVRRVEACDVCRGYLKVIAAAVPIPPEELAVRDLATLTLDFAAQRHGFTRGPGGTR